MKRVIVIFSDLDGTMLDQDSYSFQGALPALARIKRCQVPLILTTSKTRIEVVDVQAELGICEPFIVENGAAVFFPAVYRGFRMEHALKMPPYCAMVLGRPYGEIRRFFEVLKERFPVQGFGDLSAKDVARLADLPLRKAQWAKRREFTEPFVLGDMNCLDEIEERAEQEGMKITTGGRFHHLIGADQDKGLAVVRTREVFATNCPEGIVSVALGDSPNDLPMFRNVDIPILIPQRGGHFTDMEVPRLRKANSPGSRGWNEAVEEVLDELQENTR